MLEVEDDLPDTPVGIRRSRAYPGRNRKRWAVQNLFERGQSLGVEYGRGIDLEDGQNLTARSRLVDRDTHEIEGRGVERAADIDDVDAGLPIAATGTCGDDQEQAGDKEGATHVSGG